MKYVVLTVLISATAFAQSHEILARDVEIRRTAYGVPHILGQSEKAAAFGLAWAQCEDHFPLVYKAMVRGRGEMSQRYGASDSHLRFDFQMRQLRARKHVVDSFHRLPQDYRDTLHGFAAGINAYMESHPDEPEPWMTPVTAHDVAAAWEIAVMRFTFLRGDAIGRFREGIAESREARIAQPEPRDESVGSNAIALAPSRTTSGNAMLLNNPHQPWSEDAWYYEAHVTVPGRVNFYGSTFVGCHLLTTGFNEHLGWAHTTNYPDLAELYEVDLDPNRPGHYRFDGGSVAIEHETVSVTLDDGSIQSEDMYWSPLGPVIEMDDEHAYILRAAGYQQTFSGVQWFRMARAASFDEFRDAVAMHAIPMFNITYADREGNIFYLWNGTMPDMPHERNEYAPVPAATSNDIWTSFHELDELMQFTNPAGGYVQNCNSPPYMTNLHEPLPREDFPAHFPDNDLSLRTQQGLDLIHNERKFSLQDLLDAKHAMPMWLAHRVKEDLVAVLEDSDLADAERQALHTLKTWDNSASPESVGSVLFKVWWDRYRRGDALYVNEWSAAAPMTTPNGIGSPKRAVAAFQEAVAETVERWGRHDVAWGDVHRLRRGGLDLPVGGGSWRLGCFRVCEFDEAEDGKLVMNGGDGFVIAVEFGEIPIARSVLAYGQSGRAESPHYADQLRMFSEHKLKPVAFTEDAIRDSLIRAYHPLEN